MICSYSRASIAQLVENGTSTDAGARGLNTQGRKITKEKELSFF